MSYKRSVEEKPLFPGCFLVSNSLTFQVEAVLGEGAFAKVYKCVRFGGTTPFAIKVFKKTHHCHEDAKAEVRADSCPCPCRPQLPVWPKQLQIRVSSVKKPGQAKNSGSRQVQHRPGPRSVFCPGISLHGLWAPGQKSWGFNEGTTV